MFDSRDGVEPKEASPVARTRGARAKTVRPAAEGDRAAGAGKGLKIDVLLSRKGISPFDEVEWERRKAAITDDKGKVVFEQENVEVPKLWSMLATNVVASKYFYGGVALVSASVPCANSCTASCAPLPTAA